MISVFKPVAAVVVAASLALSPSMALAQAPSASTAGPSAKDFGREPAIANVTVAPDGKHVAGLISTDGVDRVIAVWDATDFEKKPIFIGSQRMRLLGLRFLKNDRLLVQAIQPLTVGADKFHLVKSFVTDLEGSKFTPLLPTSGAQNSTDAKTVNALRDAAIIDTLPRDPTNVLVLDQRLGSEGDIYKVDLYSGRAARIDRGSDRYGSPQTDLKGEVRARQAGDFDKGAFYCAQYRKIPMSGAWAEHFRWYARDREPVEVLGFDTDPNIAFIATNKGSDKIGIFEYDIRARKILEPLFQHPLWDAGSIITSRGEADYGRILGFTYNAETRKIFWTDDALKGADDQLRKALGDKTVKVSWVDPATNRRAAIDVVDGVEVQVLATSNDMQTLVIEKGGPKQPPEYYVLKNGKVNLLGRSRPWLDTKAIGDVRLVEYQARDGLMIPGILTTPPKDRFGAGPYPTLIVPHGGPWARDNMDWDVTGWTQYFAGKGFVVLQPQYRGSDGWGQKLWRAGDGEWGGKMQDDKDDGAKWLIAERLAAPDRIAMFGYSYGGYAALAASIRPNGLYQCAISGAGGSLGSMKRATFDNRFLREMQNPSVRGLDAIEHAAEASIPLFIYHGERDTIVDIHESEQFVSRLKASGKPYRYLEVKDMGHTITTWGPGDTELQLTEVEKYLTSDCGPGGI